jgi:hypothetical protein
MPEAKVYAIKEGPVHTVYMDQLNNQPIPLASINDRPVGGTPITYISRAQLESAFPGYEVICLQKQGNAKVIKKDPTVAVEAASILARVKKSQPTPNSGSKTKPLDIQTGSPIQSGYRVTSDNKLTGINVEVQNDPRYLHAQEFLKRLQVAYQYASKKNKRTLEIQCAVIKELLDEVFGEE